MNNVHRYVSISSPDVGVWGYWIAACDCGFRGGTYPNEADAIRAQARHARALRAVQVMDRYRPAWASVHDYIDACGYPTPTLDLDGKLSPDTAALVDYLSSRPSPGYCDLATDQFLIAGIIAIAHGRTGPSLLADMIKRDAPSGRAALR